MGSRGLGGACLGGGTIWLLGEMLFYLVRSGEGI